MLAAAAELYRKWAEMDKLILTDGDVIDHAQIKVTYWNGLAVKTSGNWDLTRGAQCSSAWHWLKKG
ncbi:hypothetical protein BANRA_04953 [Escherichia coli]|nr:hypothetical protein BANRA_04953 [Escherichia coli]